MAATKLTLKEKVAAFLAKHGGSAEAAVTELLTDNARYRERLRNAADGPYKPDARVAELEGENRALEGEVERLSLLVPPKDAIVLTGDDAKEHTALKALGKAEELKKQLDELPTLRTKVSDTEAGSAATEAAKLLKWNADATVGLVRDKQLVVTLVDGNKDGKAIKVPHVRPKSDEKAATVPLEDWVKKDAAYLMPALSATSGTTTQQQTTQTIPFTTQAAGGSPAATGDVVADFAKNSQAARDAAPNPLFPRTVAVTK